MSLASKAPNYEPIARLQNEFKNTGKQLEEGIIPALDQILLSHLPKGSRILDLGCGCGHLVQQLYVRGYKVTGLDASERLLSYARKNAPESEFILSDIRQFELPVIFDAVLSNDVLLFILNNEDLKIVFQNVYTALQDNGVFVFTIPITEWIHEIALKKNINHVYVNEESSLIELFYYQPEERMWEIQVTGFELIEENWQRSNTNWLRKDHFLDEVQSSLKEVGFTEINYYNTKDFRGSEEAGMACFVCRKTSVAQ
ncbi:SAM-dependent methyltransferase [Gloeocapsopsis sp. AAB1 = 1H9]|uniref:SAM-dependent methyltransferase n=2 Tax=Gloeocapsopsis TaxID=693222 RepID=A0A6N8G175_9CHRO|nr:SAM-dependent methyltransferase [Gloeocapsopsis dulcis AAB1 = 1H9]